MREKRRMEAGLIYDPADETILNEQSMCLKLLYDYNATKPYEMEKREALLKKMFGKIGEGCYIEPPFRANWGADMFLWEKMCMPISILRL